jgi:hypothetical protein
VLNFNASSYVVGEDGTVITEIIVTRSGNLAEEITATLVLNDGTALVVCQP